MADPSYRYSPWTPERRRAASERAKKRWEEKRARERAEREEAQQTVTFRLHQARFARKREMDEIAARWHLLKEQVAELDVALELTKDLGPLLRKYGIKGEVR